MYRTKCCQGQTKYQEKVPGFISQKKRNKRKGEGREGDRKGEQTVIIALKTQKASSRGKWRRRTPAK